MARTNPLPTRAQRGFTLVELMLYVALAGTLLLAMTLFFGQSLQARVKSQTMAEVDQQSQAALEEITQAVQAATAFTVPTHWAQASSLSLVMPAGGPTPTVFAVSGGTLQITEGVGAPVALTNSHVRITNFTVTDLSRSGTPGIVQISFDTDYVSSSPRQEYSYHKTFVTSVALRRGP